MQVLLILNDPPYGTERSYNGLRLAHALTGKGAGVTVFLMADATGHGIGPALSVTQLRAMLRMAVEVK